MNQTPPGPGVCAGQAFAGNASSIGGGFYLIGTVPSVRCLCLILQRRQWLILPAFACLNRGILDGFGLSANIYLINSHWKPTVCMELWRKESKYVL